MKHNVVCTLVATRSPEEVDALMDAVKSAIRGNFTFLKENNIKYDRGDRVTVTTPDKVRAESATIFSEEQEGYYWIVTDGFPSDYQRCLKEQISMGVPPAATPKTPPQANPDPPATSSAKPGEKRTVKTVDDLGIFLRGTTVGSTNRGSIISVVSQSGTEKYLDDYRLEGWLDRHPEDPTLWVPVIHILGTRIYCYYDNRLKNWYDLNV